MHTNGTSSIHYWQRHAWIPGFLWSATRVNKTIQSKLKQLNPKWNMSTRLITTKRAISCTYIYICRVWGTHFTTTTQTPWIAHSFSSHTERCRWPMLCCVWPMEGEVSRWGFPPLSLGDYWPLLWAVGHTVEQSHKGLLGSLSQCVSWKKIVLMLVKHWGWGPQ